MDQQVPVDDDVSAVMVTPLAESGSAPLQSPNQTVSYIHTRLSVYLTMARCMYVEAQHKIITCIMCMVRQSSSTIHVNLYL